LTSSTLAEDGSDRTGEPGMMVASWPAYSSRLTLEAASGRPALIHGIETWRSATSVV
jgi:hypothetical protein